jgi:hypothetical protein
MWDAPHNPKFHHDFFDGWIELIELHKKKYVSNLKKKF